MKKISIIILTILLLLSLVACAGNNKNGSAVAGGNSAQNPPKSYNNLPGTNVSEYPNSQLVYSSKYELVYSTNDSGEAVNNFYKNHPNLKNVMSGGSQEGYYAYTTPLTDLLRGIGTDQNKFQEKTEQINAYINEHGGLNGLVIYDANVGANFKEATLGNSIFSEIPHDKTLIIYLLIEKQ